MFVVCCCGWGVGGWGNVIKLCECACFVALFVQRVFFSLIEEKGRVHRVLIGGTWCCISI